jgi:high-affinity iron transporter
MARNLFSVPIFFIVFRETLEAAIIISVLLGLAEQIVQDDSRRSSAVNTTMSSDEKDGHPGAELTTGGSEIAPLEDDFNARRRLSRKLRIQVGFHQSYHS